MTDATMVLKRSAWLAWVLIAGSMASLSYMVLDSSPPFKALGYTVNKPRAGELLRADVLVARDLGRECSVEFSRHLFDSRGTRWEVQPQTNMPSAAIRQLEDQAPGHLKLAIAVPSGMAPGPARLVTPLEYACNPWHAVRPIVVMMTIEFEVSP